MRGGQIRVVSTNGLICHIEMRLLTNTASEIKFGEGLLDFGDGTTATTPTIDNIKLTELPNLGLVIYSIDHTYAAPGTYVLSYLEPNLTGGILNIINSVETKFYLESSVVVSLNQSVSSPKFPTDPIFICPSHRPYAFSTAAIDDSTRNDFFYKYEMDDVPYFVQGYTVPENLKINSDNGIVTWDTKFNGQYQAGMFWIVVKINKYSKLDGYLGYVSRAMQIVVEDSNSKLDLTSSVVGSNNRIDVIAGQEKKIKLILSDNNDAPDLNFDLYYNKIIKNNISITQYDSSSGSQKMRVAVLSLKTTPGIVSDLPYPVTLRARSAYIIDITFLYMTKAVDLPTIPVPPVIVLGLSDKDDLKIYPNPFHSELYLDGTTSREVTFIDSFGQIVLRSGLYQGQPLNTTSLPGGVYILQLTGENGVTRKFKVARD